MFKHCSKDFFAHFNMKIELIISLFSIVGIIIYFTDLPLFAQLGNNLLNYFTAERISNISAFFSIAVGIYIAVVTIIATSVIGISKELLLKKLDYPLVLVIIWGMVESLLAVALSVFLTSNHFIYFWLLATTNLLAIVSFVKFIRLLLLIFKKNLEMMAKHIDDEDNYRNDLLTHIELISEYLRKNKK